MDPRPPPSTLFPYTTLFRSFDRISPLAVAYCAGPDDVARTIGWARKHGIRLAPRCGGHSYGGYSTTPGVIVDVSPLNTIAVDERRAVVGAEIGRASCRGRGGGGGGGRS